MAIVQLLEVLNNQTLNTDSKIFGIVNIELGKCYKNLNEYDNSLLHLLKGLDFLEKSKSLELLCDAKVTLGEFYRKIGDYSNATKTLDGAIILFNNNKVLDEYIYYRALSRKAAVYNETNVLDSAIFISYQVLKYGKQTKDEDLQAMAHNEIGFSYLNLNQPDSSIFHYQKAEQLWLQINDLESAVHAKTNRAICIARNYQDDSSAIKLLYVIEDFILSNNVDYPLYNIYLYLSTEYKHKKEYDSI